jgi:hypothetical protein
MKITIVASLFAIRDMNVYSGQSFTFDVKIVVFEKLSPHPDPSPDGKYWFCPG